MSNGYQVLVTVIALLLLLSTSADAKRHQKKLKVSEESYLNWVRSMSSRNRSGFMEAKNKFEPCKSIKVDKNLKLGNFTTLNKAIQSIPLFNPCRVVISVGPGIYREKIEIPATMAYVTLQGSGARKTIVRWDDTADRISQNGQLLGTYGSATFAVNAPYFVAKDITFKNGGAEIIAKKDTSNPAPVADAPAKDEAGKAPVNDDLEFRTSEEKKTGEKSEENKPDEKSSTEKKTEETKQDLISIVEKKPDAPEMEVTEEQKAASEKEKETVEAKPAEIAKLEMLVKIEEKPDMEAHKTEKPVDESVTDKKPATPELEHELQKPVLDAEEKENEELKPEVTTNIVVTEKEPETSDAKSPDELRPVLDAEKQKTEEKLTATEVSTKVALEPASDTELPKTEK